MNTLYKHHNYNITINDDMSVYIRTDTSQEFLFPDMESTLEFINTTLTEDYEARACYIEE